MGRDYDGKKDEYLLINKLVWWLIGAVVTLTVLAPLAPFIAAKISRPIMAVENLR